MDAPWFIVALIGLLGLAIGSFLNVVIYRVPREESILFPASHCPTCRTPIKFRHNIPLVSWLALKGKCAYCQGRIAVRYPLVEAGTAALFVGITLSFGLTLQLPAYLYLAAVGVVVVMIDADMRRLPDSIVLPSYIVSVLLLMPAGAVDTSWWRAERALIGMLALVTIYFTLALAYPAFVPFGDVKLAGLVGLYLGWLSLGAVALGILISFALAVVSNSAVHRVPAGGLPVGSCLVSAAVLAVIVAAPLSSWYGSLLPLP